MTDAIHFRVTNHEWFEDLPGQQHLGDGRYAVTSQLIADVERLDVHGVIEVLDWGQYR